MAKVVSPQVGQIKPRRTGAQGSDAAPRRVLSRRSVVAIVLLFVCGLVWWQLPGWLMSGVQENLRQRDPDRAQQWLRWAQRAGLPAGEAEFWQGRIARKTVDIEGAEKHLNAALSLGYDTWRVQAEGWLVQAQAGLLASAEPHLAELLMKSSGDDTREVCEAFVNGYVLNYRVDEAKQLIAGWEQDFPTDPWPHLFTGRIHEHSLRWEEALSAYRKGIAIDPGCGAAYYHLARITLGQKQPEAAVASYQQAKDRLRFPAAAIVGEAHCWRLQRQYEPAAVLLKQVIALPLPEIERSYRRVGDPAETAQIAPWTEYAQVLLAQRDGATAVKTLQVAIERQPRNQALRNLYAAALRADGQLEAAHQEMLRVQAAQSEISRLTNLIEQVRIDQNNLQARTELGVLFVKHLSENQGLVWLHSALTIDPAYGPAHTALADYFESLPVQTDETRRSARDHRQRASAAPVVVPENPAAQSPR